LAEGTVPLTPTPAGEQPSPTSKSSQSITTYLPKDLGERVAAARSAGSLDPKAVIKAALEEALDGRRPGAADSELRRLAEFLGDPKVASLWAGEEGTPVEVACRIIERLAHPAVMASPADKPEVTYEVVWADSMQEFQARLDSITSIGGQPVSVAVAPASANDRFCLLVSWPP
jgi:hypothetical protein